MYSIGIDLGGTSIAIGIVNQNGQIIEKNSTPTLRGRSYKEIVKDMAALIIKILENGKVSLYQIDKIGVGTPGVVDKKKGSVIYSSNLVFEDALITKELSKYFDLPIYLENDANCAAYAEYISGASINISNSVMLTLGTGIGGGIIINNDIYNGFNYAAAEIGHMVIKSKGRACSCGRKGCFEAYSSATALINYTKEKIQENKDSLINKFINQNNNILNAKIPFDAAKVGDELAIRIINRYIDYLAVGTSNIINIFQPEVVIIGGGISAEGEALLKPLKDKVYTQTYSVNRLPKPEIRIAASGNDAGIIGAAFLSN